MLLAKVVQCTVGLLPLHLSVVCSEVMQEVCARGYVWSQARGPSTSRLPLRVSVKCLTLTLVLHTDTHAWTHAHTRTQNDFWVKVCPWSFSVFLVLSRSFSLLWHFISHMWLVRYDIGASNKQTYYYYPIASTSMTPTLPLQRLTMPDGLRVMMSDTSFRQIVG